MTGQESRVGRELETGGGLRVLLTVNVGKFLLCMVSIQMREEFMPIYRYESTESMAR